MSKQNKEMHLIIHTVTSGKVLKRR